ncbi:ABC transporter substrate-binding protein [Robbsia sp. KACC 23696]|uniref:ABC transporter substrate-binding protein n=1 Tax=Robbsia sp. KACC 23696 TaxID=3149231 RepID=UPI00325A54A1
MQSRKTTASPYSDLQKDADGTVAQADGTRNPARRATLRGLVASGLGAVLGNVALPVIAAESNAARGATAAPSTPTGATAGATIAPVRGGRLTLLVNPEPNVLVSFATSAGAEEKAAPKITEGLLSYDFDVKPQPQLARAWSISEDGLTYTFHLRQGVTWHDGKPFIADDVKRSVQLLKQYHPRGSTTFANVTAVDTPDRHTAIIRLSKPAPYLIYALAAQESPILPSHLYGTGDPLSNPNNAKPIGTGPYIFAEWVRGSHVRLVRNPHYWDSPKPYLDELILSFIGDPSSREAALETGELLLAGENPVPLPDVARLKSQPTLAVETRGYSYDAAQTQLQFNLDNRYLKDVRVRRAIAHAIDREAILRTVFFGFGIPSPSPISPLLTQYYDPTVPTYPLDRAKAAQLLDESGYPIKNGARFSLTIDYNPYDPSFQRLAEYLRQALRAIGINASVRSQDFATYVKRIYTDREFDLDANFLGNTFDPSVGVQRLYWSKNFRKGVPFSNATHYNDPEVDHLLESAAVEPDPAKRIALFKAFQQKVGADLPIYNLITLKQVTIYNKRVHQHTVTADGLDGNLADVFLTPA